MRMSLSLASSFGVVPLTTSEWKPEIAPQAMVMNTNGKTLAAEDRPGAVDELGQRRHLDLRLRSA